MSGHCQSHLIPGQRILVMSALRKRTSELNRVMSALCQKRHTQATYAPPDATYSITTFADASRPEGTLIPIALAVDRLMTSSNWVGCTTGMSAGFSPLRTRPV